MTQFAAPRLPLRYGRDRSLVDRTRIRWGGFGDIVIGTVATIAGVASASQNAGAAIVGIVFGLAFLFVGIGSWTVTSFGNIHYSQLTPGRKTIVVFGSIGFIALMMFFFYWFIVSTLWSLVSDR